MCHAAGPAVCSHLKNVYFIPSKDKWQSARHWHFVCFPAWMGHKGPAAPTRGTIAGTLGRKARLQGWHSGGSRCSLTLFVRAKLYKTTVKWFVRICRVNAELKKSHLPVIKVWVKIQTGERPRMSMVIILICSFVVHSQPVAHEICGPLFLSTAQFNMSQASLLGLHAPLRLHPVGPWKGHGGTKGCLSQTASISTPLRWVSAAVILKKAKWVTLKVTDQQETRGRFGCWKGYSKWNTSSCIRK